MCVLSFSAQPYAKEQAITDAFSPRQGATELVVGNAHIERTWRIQEGLLTATSFRDLDAGVEWLARPAGESRLRFRYRSARRPGGDRR